MNERQKRKLLDRLETERPEHPVSHYHRRLHEERAWRYWRDQAAEIERHRLAAEMAERMAARRSPRPPEVEEAIAAYSARKQQQNTNEKRKTT